MVDEDEYVKSEYTRHEKENSLDEKEILAKTGMTQEDVDVENAKFALNHQDGADSHETMMMAFYMLAALQHFEGMPKSKVKETAIER